MSEKRILHVSAKNVTVDEIEVLRNQLAGEFPEREVIVTDDSIDVFEMPTAEEFADEITERIVEEIEKPNFSERL